MKIAQKRRLRFQAFGAQFLLGIAGLALITFICFQLGFGVARTGYVYVILVALLSVLGSFTASVILSFVAAACLNYFFAPPLFEFRLDASDDIVRIALFLTTSLVVTALTTKLSASEERFRVFVDIATDAFFVLDRSLVPSPGLATATAALAAGIFIADSVSALEISFSVFYVLVVLVAARFSQPAGMVLITGGCLALTLLSHVVSFHKGDVVEGAVNAAINIGAILLTAVLVLKDQTRETLRQELDKRAAELTTANKELESFAYSVSHDLRAPLRHVVGYAELLQKHSAPALDEKAQRYMRTIQDAATRMGHLIDDLLGFSRVGRVETKKTFVSLKQLVEEAIAELAEETAGREIDWKVGALPRCYGDRSMLKLVLVNLIANAVKFTRTQSRAEIEIGWIDEGQNDAVFVRDNGVGFDMSYVNKLFGVFQRLHLAEEFEGTGIGLATVQRIVHRHGGEVRAEGALDRGATFYISLPKAQGATDHARKT